MAVIDLVRRVWQILYNLWCMCCLYAIAAVYVKLEIVRKLSTSSEIFRKLNTSSARRLNLDSDLPKDLTKFTIIMTGGSRGIGWEAAKVFLAKGAHVIITTSASGDRLSKLEAKLLSNCPHLDNPNKLQVRTMDLNSFESVGSFVAWFKSTGLDLNILINNAGQMYAPFRLTLDGYESHWQVNYLSHVLLVFLLLPILEKTSRQTGINSRIVNVASATHFARNLSLEDVNGLRLYSPYHSYAQSKLAQIMFTYKLASILSQGTCDGSDVSPITVNTLHPGVALTELYENVWWVKMFPAFAQCFFRVSCSLNHSLNVTRSILPPPPQRPSPLDQTYGAVGNCQWQWLMNTTDASLPLNPLPCDMANANLSLECVLCPLHLSCVLWVSVNCPSDCSSPSCMCLVTFLALF